MYFFKCSYTFKEKKILKLETLLCPSACRFTAGSRTRFSELRMGKCAERTRPPFTVQFTMAYQSAELAGEI